MYELILKGYIGNIYVSTNNQKWNIHWVFRQVQNESIAPLK